MHVLRFRQLGRRPSQHRRRPVGRSRRLCHRLWRRRTRPGGLPALQRDFRARGRGVLRGHRHRRQFAVADRLQQARRHLLLPIANRISSRTNAARRNISPAARGCMRSTARWARSTRTIWNGPSAASRPKSSIGDGRWPSRSPSRPRSAPSTALDEIADDLGHRQSSIPCRCTWTAPALPMRWSRSTRRRPK